MIFAFVAVRSSYHNQYCNIKSFFYVEIDGEPADKIAVSVFLDTEPKTLNNLKVIWKSGKEIFKSEKPLHYWFLVFHREIPVFKTQADDFIYNACIDGQ